MRRGVGEERADESGAGDPLGGDAGHLQRVLGAAREAHHQRPLGAGRVHHGEAVAGELGGSVPARVAAAIRAAVAQAVHHEHAEMAREVGDLHLPVPGVNQPRREQEQGVLALAVDLIEDALAVTLDEPLAVGIASAALLRGCPQCLHVERRRFYPSMDCHLIMP